MLDIGSKITQLRKAKNWSQEDLAKQINSSRVMVGNYERNTNMPSIEVIVKMSKSFNVTVDFLIGEGEFSTYDKEIIKRIEDIDQLDEDTKKHLFFLVDNVIQNYKTKKAFDK
ncbi:helix-turn-helix transcriptional regulator [Flavobacterium sp.]|jgi:transcriptional regulator with XRE-family HTH domain|uniref:helix-turn-helix domain-containing protein n=1 Tax=Flavobacterium sp. TaxID=239 RepID=UPI00286B0D1E|nr:helix-turn-helix transcriptional regulator [Flavobacterium sp.]